MNQRSILRENHPAILNTKEHIALVHYNQFNFDKSYELETEVFDQRKSIGEECIETIVTMNTVAMTMLGQGKGQEAHAMLSQAIEIAERKGESHHHLLSPFHKDLRSIEDVLIKEKAGRYRDRKLGAKLKIRKQEQREEEEEENAHSNMPTSREGMAAAVFAAMGGLDERVEEKEEKRKAKKEKVKEKGGRNKKKGKGRR